MKSTVNEHQENQSQVLMEVFMFVDMNGYFKVNALCHRRTFKQPALVLKKYPETNILMCKIIKNSLSKKAYSQPSRTL